ncbi:MAG: 5-oxoprolinase [Deltaproteobacteria bacterium]|nr:5-oxoprolinase [Deltaproteobacteria bacterium]
MNRIKIVGRGRSTVVDAYLSPVIDRHLQEIRKATGTIPIEFMVSAGGLVSPDHFHGRNALFSGPAGGVIAVAEAARQAGAAGVIGFDMGGTSTDICRFDGEFEKCFEREVGGVELSTEMLNIVSVASGGGSVLWFDGQKIRVGPESAGADPGPACYGFGGPLTVTDANLVTGRIIADAFPKTFGADRKSGLDVTASLRSFEEMTERINTTLDRNLSVRETALGFLRIADEKMALAIREISVSRGVDVRNDALVCFGGAGGQHACRVADLLEINRVVFHPLSSLMSAYGIGLARPTVQAEATLLEPFGPKGYEALEERYRVLERNLSGKPAGKTAYSIHRWIDLRQRGTENFIPVPFGGYEKTVTEFCTRYEKIFGFVPAEGSLEVVHLRVEGEEEEEFFPPGPVHPADRKHRAEAVSFQTFHDEKGTIKAPVYLRKDLPAGTRIEGPAFVVDPHTTFLVETGFEATVLSDGVVLADRVSRCRIPASVTSRGPDPVLLEVFNNLFMSVAGEMGHTLRNTAHSVNIKERLDFSCAVFDASGGLVANAPHIPVHLGSMGDTVKAVLADRKGRMQPGDLYLTNNPYKGGSHLPDTTVICPVFSREGEIRFFTAARGHHADIGGAAPGSMPVKARDLSDEGVLIDDFLLVRKGHFREAELTRLLSDAPRPVRNVEERIFDLQAQIAACHKGVGELQRMIRRYGWKTVRRYMDYIQDNAEFSVQQALLKFLLKKDPFIASFEDRLDDGTPLRVRIEIRGGERPPSTVTAIIDFAGTGARHREDNLNTPLSVTRSAVLYVVRTLTCGDIPLNSGCLRPITLRVPEGSILNPPFPAPVATGNVETSQRVVDLLLGALGVAGASQGTMNNLLFEVEGESPYYETVAGGSGALDGCPGASGVQVHMTNTRITDPEILEVRHPGVRLRRFTLRKGSGGDGKFPGGNGVIRKIGFQKPATLSILSERRKIPPYGMAGGGSGQRGVNRLCRADGTIEELPHRVALHLEAGDSILLKTPGGGGFGKTDEQQG